MKKVKIFSISLTFLFIISAVLLGISTPLYLHAQGSTGLRIQPAIIEERVDPGQTFSSVLRATNLGSETKTFYILKRNISHISSAGTPIFVGEEEEVTGFEVTSWIKISFESITIAVGKTKEIPFSIEVPEDATPGGHFGGIFLSLTPQRPEETGIGIGYQVGTIINLRISGEIFEEAQIREFRTDKAIYRKPEVTFITRVKNAGNVLIRPRGPLDITDFFGKKVATLRINDSGAGVFPQTVRQFETTWKGEGLAFGRYQAITSLVYGEEGRKTISGTLSFWIIPLNIVLPVVGGIIALILVVFVFIKLYIRRKLRKIRETTEGTIPQERFGAGQKGLELYASRKYGASVPFSRLALITIIMLIFTLLFLVALFFFFA